MDSPREQLDRDVALRGPRADRAFLALPSLWLGCCLLGAPAIGAQVPVLQDQAASPATWAAGIVRWEPSFTLTLGSSVTVLGEEVLLAYEPGATLQSGSIVPGGIQAPFRLQTELGISNRAKPGLRPVPSSVQRPSDSSIHDEDLALLGPGAEFVLWSKSAAAEGWAYVRVLEVSSSTARIELAEFSAEVAALQRDPAGLMVEEDASLSWTSLEIGSASEESVPGYTVERRAVDEERWAVLASDVQPAADQLYRFSDPSIQAEPPTVFEYRVSRSDGATGDASAGRVGDFVRVHGFRKDTATVAPGSRINLVSGLSVEAGSQAHIEMGRAGSGSVMLEPLGEVRLNGVVVKGELDLQSWRLPEASDPSWLPGKAVRVRDGEEVAFLLPNGLAGRISIEELGSERWVLRRSLSYDGTGLLPRPPAAPLKMYVEAASDPDSVAGRLLMSLAGPHLGSGMAPRDVALVLEHQPKVGIGEWEVLAATGPGTTTFDVDDAFGDGAGGRRSLARLRLRYQVAFGPRSAPGASFDVLTAGSDSALRLRDLDVALAELASEDFVDRVQASAFLSAMGDEARPALEAVAQTSARTPAGLAALELLRTMDERGGAGVRLGVELRALALESLRGRGSDFGEDEPLDHWLGVMPPGLTAQAARGRAHALLMAVDVASRGGATAGPRGTVSEDCERMLAWAQAVATADPDEGVRWIARFMGEVGLRPSLASFEPEGPAWLLPPERRSSPERLDFGWGDQPGTAEELRWQLEARPELASLHYGPALARLHAALAPAEQLTRPFGVAALSEPGVSDSFGLAEPRLFDYDSSAAELVLRLVERARAPGADPVLLAAAESLLPGPRLTLEAWRSVSDRRLATPSADAVPRERIEIEGHSLNVLNAVLSDLTGDAGVDIVLGAGSWTNDEETPGATGKNSLGSTSLVVRCNDVRLMSGRDGPAWLHAGLRVYGKNVVLQDLIVDHAQGQAITVLDGGHVVVLRSELRGVGTVAHLQDGTAEIIESKLSGADPASPPATAVRLILNSRLYGRASLFDAGSIFVSSGTEAWLDRCVLDARSRMLVQAQDKGHLFVRESLLRGEGSGLFRVSSGLLVGSVIDVPRDPLGRLPQSLRDGGIRVSPRFFRLVQEGQVVPSAMQLDAEPMGATTAGMKKRR